MNNKSTFQVRLQSGFYLFTFFQHNISTTLLCALRDYKTSITRLLTF